VPELTRSQAEDFLYEEARLLDDRQFDAWLALFTDDAHYWIPSGRGDDAGLEAHLAYDDLPQLRDRVWQLQQPRHSSQHPASLTSHLLGNVQVQSQDGERALVRSSLLVTELRKAQGGSGEPRSFAGHSEHHLRWEDDRWRIECKKVWLLSRDLPIFNLTFLL
jgi:3-phenylpropionate/cinnamic acid dioxygenase small subunit